MNFGQPLFANASKLSDFVNRASKLLTRKYTKGAALKAAGSKPMNEPMARVSVRGVFSF
jgi:hypothetical protein